MPLDAMSINFPPQLGIDRNRCVQRTQPPGKTVQKSPNKPATGITAPRASKPSPPTRSSELHMIICLHICKELQLFSPFPAHSGISRNIHAGRISPGFARLWHPQRNRHLPFLHVSGAKPAPFWGSGDSQRLQQSRAELAAVCTERLRKRRLPEHGVMQYLVLFIISSGFLCFDCFLFRLS